MRDSRRVVLAVLGAQAVLFVVLGFLFRTFLIPALAIALLALALLFVFLLRWQRVDARRAALLTRGTRVPARLVSSRPTAVRIRNRVVMAHTFEARTDGRVVRAEAKAFVHLPLGTAATIAFDPASPRDAVVVEDLDGV